MPKPKGRCLSISVRDGSKVMPCALTWKRIPERLNGAKCFCKTTNSVSAAGVLRSFPVRFITLIDKHLPFGFGIFRGLVDRHLISLKDHLLATNLYISLSLQDLRAAVETERIGIDNDRALLFPRRLLHVLSKASRRARQRDQDRPQDG